MGRRSGIREFNGRLIIGQQSIHQYPNYWFSSDLHKVTKTKWQFLLQKVYLSVFFSGSFGHHECLDLWVIQRKLVRRNSCREERTSKLMAACWLQRLRWFFFQLIFIFIDVPKNHVQLFFRKVLEVFENFWDFMHFLSYRFISVYE